MTLMFIVGIILALGLGVSSGMLYVKHERSKFTKKFKAELVEITREYEHQLKELQQQDAEAVLKAQEALKASINEMLMTDAVPPPPGKFN